ncbi:hypothetical protein LCGC14_1219820, partial [marine sediment metagenome]
MYLEIFDFDFEDSEMFISEKQNDYDFFSNDDVDIFVYGYPFLALDSEWVKSEDIYGWYINDKTNELQFVNDLEGVYSIIILDRELDVCYIITDRYGVYTLFYYRKNGSFIISDKIDSILKFMRRIEIDKKSILEYLTFGYMNRIGNKTHIKGINEFEGANIYTINNGNISYENYWKYPNLNMEVSNVSFLKEFNSHIQTGFNLEKEKILTFTGGLDTRTILSSIIDKADDLHCYTYGVKKSGDIKIAEKITKQFNIKQDSMILDKDFIMDIPEKIKNNINMFNGLTPMAFQLHWYEFCERNKDNGKLLFLGISGDEFWRCHHADADKIKNCLNINDVISFILGDYMIQKNKTLNVFKGLEEDDIKNILRSSIKNVFGSWMDDYFSSFDPSMVVDFFNLKYHYANWVSNLVKFYGRYFKIFLGLVNKNLLSSLRYFDLNDRVSGSLQKYIIEKNSPELAKIPYCHYRFNEHKSVKMFIKKIIYNVKFLANRVFHRLFNFNLFKYFPDLPHYYWVWLPKYHKQFVLDTLDYDNMITKSLFNKEELQKIVKLFLKSDYSTKAFVISLISLEIYLKNINKGYKLIIN